MTFAFFILDGKQTQTDSDIPMSSVCGASKEGPVGRCCRNMLFWQPLSAA
jgi:hypothetical protein